MVRKTSKSGGEAPAPTAARGDDKSVETPRRSRRKTAADGTAKAAKGEQQKAPSFADSQRKLPDPPPAEQQRPSPEAAAASDESSFEANARAAGQMAGQVYGAVRDTVLKGADAVGGLAADDGLKQAADKAVDTARQNKGVLVAGAALVFGGLPAAAVTAGAAIRAAKLTLVDKQDPLEAGKQVLGEINELAEKAPGRVAEITGQAAELAEQAKGILTGWAARFVKKD